jgi:dolichyl-diphosphooligosaccharide--protein glycosyltransferase
VTDNRSEVYRNTETFLDEHNDGETVLEHLLAVDGEEETWEFSDLELDSGTFGEVVSAGVVEKVDEEYQLANRQAVSAVVTGEEVAEPEDADAGFDVGYELDYTRVGAMVGALLIIVLTRTIHYRSVFMNGRVVSPGNDPYFFRYWQEQLLAEASSPLSLQVLVNPPWDDGSFNQRPLTHATNWWFAELLGGDQWAADFVAAWLPIVFTILLAIVVYYLALVLTEDVRVGVASVLFLALAPVHAVYTGLGLLHHRYNQYLWFGLILLTLVWLATDVKERRTAVEPGQAVRDHLAERKTWGVAALFGLAFAFWTHSWGGSLEFFVPLCIYAGLRVCMDVREGISPGRANLPLVAGFGFGATLAIGLHLALSWHGLPAPLLSVVTFGAAAALVGIGEFWHRRELTARKLLTTEVVLAVVGVIVVTVFLAMSSDLVERIVNTLTASAPEWQTSVQSESMYSTEQFVIFGPIAQIGLEFYIALGALAWCIALVYREYEPGWLALAVVTLHYVVLSGIMVRFAGRLVIAMAVFGGLGLVFALSRLDLIRDPELLAEGGSSPRDVVPDSETRQPFGVPSPQRGTMVVVVCVLIFGASLVFLPTQMNQIGHDPADVGTASEIADHAESLNRDHPDNHVLATWETYRMYNYFVSGESESERLGRYGYTPLFRDEDIEGRLKGYTDSIGYLVLTEPSIDIPAEQEQPRLTDQLGLPDDRFNSLEQYRLIALDDDHGIAVFAVVPGATVALTGDGGEQVRIATTVTDDGRSFTYARNATLDSNGTATVTVPYPGRYSVGDRTIEITEADVRNNRRVSTDMRSSAGQ